jgi:hypothetical protein
MSEGPAVSLPFKLRIKIYALALAYPIGLLLDIAIAPGLWAYRKLRRRRPK